MNLYLTYKHIYNTDVAFAILNITKESNHNILFGYWVNITTSKHYNMVSDTIKIKHEDIKNWRLYE